MEAGTFAPNTLFSPNAHFTPSTFSMSFISVVLFALEMFLSIMMMCMVLMSKVSSSFLFATFESNVDGSDLSIL